MSTAIGQQPGIPLPRSTTPKASDSGCGAALGACILRWLAVAVLIGLFVGVVLRLV